MGPSNGRASRLAPGQHFAIPTVRYAGCVCTYLPNVCHFIAIAEGIGFAIQKDWLVQNAMVEGFAIARMKEKNSSCGHKDKSDNEA
jgi:hypothetical protein